MPGERRDFLAASTTTLGRELDRLGCSPRLRTVLSYLWGTYAMPPARATLGMHATVTLEYLRGAWYPEGGARSISDSLVEVIERNGGELLLDTDVSAILVEAGAVRGVQLQPGPGGTEPRTRELFAQTVVSAVDIKERFWSCWIPSTSRPVGGDACAGSRWRSPYSSSTSCSTVTCAPRASPTATSR